MKRHIHFILMLAIFIQAMIPVGFMPGKSLASSFIEICSGDGLITVAVDHDGQPVDEHQVKKPCAYSMLPSGDVPVSVIETDAAFIPESHELVTAAYVATRHYSPLPPSTAPPALI